MQQLLITTLKSTITQLVGTAGVFFLFGYILSFLQTKILDIYKKTLGWNSVLFTAWLGTMVHEMGHLLFALIFNYKVKKVNLFNPNKKTGRMGHVKYGYIKGSILHRLGKFFVGAAPLFFGAAIVLLLMYFLVPNGVELYSLLKQNYNLSIINQIKNVLINLFSSSNLSQFSFWIFIYLSLSIVTHMSPSKRDRSQMWSGLLWFGIILFAANFISLTLLDLDLTNFFNSLKVYLAVITSFFIFSTYLAFVHYLLVLIFLSPFK